jgi:hypothetical protein
MRALADSAGRVRIKVVGASGESVFFHVSPEGGGYPPGSEVEISDAWLDRFVPEIVAPFGLGEIVERTWESAAT